jgi:hypothetical protein
MYYNSNIINIYDSCNEHLHEDHRMYLGKVSIFASCQFQMCSATKNLVNYGSYAMVFVFSFAVYRIYTQLSFIFPSILL